MRVFVLALVVCVCAWAWVTFGNSKGSNGLSSEERFYLEVMKEYSKDDMVAELMESGEVIYHKIK